VHELIGILEDLSLLLLIESTDFIQFCVQGALEDTIRVVHLGTAQ
jgi:hypothetical protein